VFKPADPRYRSCQIVNPPRNLRAKVNRPRIAKPVQVKERNALLAPRRKPSQRNFYVKTSDFFKILTHNLCQRRPWSPPLCSRTHTKAKKMKQEARAASGSKAGRRRWSYCASGFASCFVADRPAIWQAMRPTLLQAALQIMGRSMRHYMVNGSTTCEFCPSHID